MKDEDCLRKYLDPAGSSTKFDAPLYIKKVSINFSPDARTWLAKKGHDPRYGARPLDRLIQTEIKDILSDEILFGRLNKGGNVFIDVENEKLTFNFNTKISLSENIRASETME